MLRSSFVNRIFASVLAILLVVNAAPAGAVPQQSVTPLPQTQNTHSTQIQPQVAALPDAPSPQESSQEAQQNTSQSTSGQQPSGQATPVGTAAAPGNEPVGVAGSRPAGAVIAPAKQRRVHTFLISVGLIAGACIAIGTVAALTHASPSQPH